MTGVQTCALPIYNLRIGSASGDDIRSCDNTGGSDNGRFEELAAMSRNTFHDGSPLEGSGRGEELGIPPT